MKRGVPHSERAGEAVLATGERAALYRALRALSCSRCGGVIREGGLFTREAEPTSGLPLVRLCRACAPFSEGGGLLDALLAPAGDLAPNVSLQAYGGAIADVGAADTAFGHRETLFELVAAGGWIDPAEDEARIAAARRYARTLEPFASGVYVNALSDEGVAGVRRAYPPEKLARLTALKDLYDPDNVFHLNQNIAPAPA